MKTQTVIAPTKKGSRIFLENVGRIGQRYNVAFQLNCIVVQFNPEGKRFVSSPSKGGVIDLESKKVAQWAAGATVAHVDVNEFGTIIIARGAK